MKKTSIEAMKLQCLLALAFLAVLAIGDYLILNAEILDEEKVAAVINISGRQRMLSQRAALFSLRLVQAQNKTERENARTSLLAAIKLMEKSHHGLIKGDPAMNLPGNPSIKVASIYFDPPLLLNTQVRNYLAEAKALAHTADINITPDNLHLQYLLQNGPTKLLKGLDVVVKQYQVENEDHIAQVQRLQAGVAIITLLILLGLGVFIFQPMIRRVKEEMEKHKAAEEAIRKSEERFALTMHGADLALWDWNVQTGKVTFNQRWAEMVGYTLDEIEPHASSWEKLIHPDDKAGVMDALNSHLEGKTPFYETEHRLRHKSGEWVWILDKGKVIERDNEGNPLRMCGTQLDITERKRVELIASRLGRILDGSFNEIYFFDPDTLKFIQVNHGARLNLGYTMEELKQMTPFDIKPEYSEDRFKALLEPLRRREKNSIDFDTIHERKDGTHYPVEIRLQFSSVEELPLFVGVVQDISERRKTEEAIKENEERYRKLFNSESDAILVVDQATYKIIDVNTAALKLYGYSKEEFLELKVFDISAEPEATKNAVNHAALGESQYFPLRMHKKKDGTEVPVELTTGHFKLKDQSIIFGVCRDITDRLKSEEQINILSQAVKQSTVTVMITDPDGNIEYVNPSFTKSSGYTFEEVKGKNPRLMKSGETPKEEYKVLWNTILSGKEWRGVFHNKRKNGELYWENTIISPLKNEMGEITHFIAIKENITERKKMERTLLDHEVFLDSVLENLQEGILAINKQGNIKLFNSAAESIFGYTSEEVLEKDITILMPEPDRQKHKEGMEILLKTGKSRIIGITIEAKGLRKDGSILPIELTVTQMELYERNLFVGVLRDITKRKEDEEHLKIAQKQVMASQKLAGIGELSAGVSHEVLNPVNIISVHVQMLQRKNKDNEALQTFCSKVRHEISRIEKIMGGLLSFSRKGEAEFVRTSIQDEIYSALDLVENNFSLDNIEITRECRKSPLEVNADKDKMRQVFLNIINNAKHAMPNGGTFTVKCKKEKKGSKTYAVIKFSDTGHGIKKENIDKIFNPFFSTKKEGEGTGMGLAVCHGIIEEHGGTIAVESEEGKGSTFIITLPC